MKVIRINKDGTMNELELKFSKNPNNVLSKNKISSGNGDIKELYMWKYEDKIIKCYGWYDGEAGFENKHELVPNGSSNFLEENSSNILLYGDIFILAFKENKCCDFCVSDYGIFYDVINEGFDDCYSDSDNSLLTEELSDDDEYIYTDDSEDLESDDDYKEKYSDNELLDTDTNDYS